MSTQIYEKPIENVKEIVTSSFKLKGDGFALQQLMKQSQVNHMIQNL